MFSVIDLPPRWLTEATLLRRRGQEALALMAESFIEDLKAEMLSEGHEALTSAGSAGGEQQADYTVAQVAEMFDRKPQTVRDWIKSGKLRAYLFNGREYRVTKAAVKEYMEEQRNGKGPVLQKSTTDLGAWRRATPGLAPR